MLRETMQEMPTHILHIRKPYPQADPSAYKRAKLLPTHFYMETKDIVGILIVFFKELVNKNVLLFLRLLVKF
jgi:hypothetical protein